MFWFFLPFLTFAFGFPTSEFPTGSPTESPVSLRGGPPPKECNEVEEERICNAVRDFRCHWFVTDTCIKNSCQSYAYGCQELATFCDFTEGSQLMQQMQCNHRGFPCKWRKGKKRGSCRFTTARPSKPLDPKGCRDTCITAKNGICEDGAPGSLESYCEYGSDCQDCGIRKG